MTPPVGLWMERVSPEIRLNGSRVVPSIARIFRETALSPKFFVMFVSHSPIEAEGEANVKRIDIATAQQAAIVMFLSAPMLASAQQSPFDTGANSLVDFALAIATPIAILVVIGAAIAAAVGRISWGWVVGAIVGIAAIFGSPQIVAWIRGMFGV